MARGHKDFGEGGQIKIIHPVTDLGEAVARLGSLNKYHRGGNVIFQTGFENGFDNCGFSSGLGSPENNLIATPTYSGGVACQLKNIGIDILTRPIELTKIGFEIAFLPLGNTSILELAIRYDNGSFVYNFEWFIYYQSDVIRLHDSTGSNQDLGAYTFTNKYVNLWHIMKGICDLPNMQYDKLFFNNKQYDCSDYEPQKTTTSGDERLTCTFFPYPTSGDISEVIIDNLIITINEE